MFLTRVAQLTSDLSRVKALPRRVVSPQDLASIADEMTEAFRTPNGTMRLNTVQGLTLKELGDVGGAFGAIGVGGGKTLITLLAPVVVGAKRPILVIPASLRDKTERERRALSKHFPVALHMRIVSYEELGRVAAAKLLETHNPDMLVFDECHRVKNRKAGVTRRVARFIHDHPDVTVAAFSGTVIKKSIKDFAHILRWCLKRGAPVPMTQEETDEWAAILDPNTFSGVAPGRFLDLGPAGDSEDIQEQARTVFRSRLTETPGVIVHDSPDVNASLSIVGLRYDTNPVTDDNFRKLRTLMEAPTGWTFSEAIIAWQLGRQLSLGLHYEFDPLAPKDWLAARKAWAQFVRKVLSRSRTYDTELQVANAVIAGDLVSPELDAWRKMRPTFEPNSVPVWHDDSALDVCEEWMAKGPGIVFCAHEFFARALAKRTGAPYYGAGGLDSKENPIEAEDGSRAIIASLQANGTGRNLQAFSRGLLTAVPPGADGLEQTIGRMHRQGQASDEVEYTVLLGCAEHLKAFWDAHEGSKAIEQMTGAKFKVTNCADLIDIPTLEEAQAFKGWAWAKELT